MEITMRKFGIVRRGVRRLGRRKMGTMVQTPAVNGRAVHCTVIRKRLLRLINHAELWRSLSRRVTENIETNLLFTAIKFLVQRGHRAQVKTHFGPQQRFAVIAVGVVLEIEVRLNGKGFSKHGRAHE